MKRTLYLLLIIAACVGASSCRRTHPIHLSTDTIEVPRPGLDTVVGVRCEAAWHVAYTPLWIKATPLSDTTLALSCKENRLSRMRTDSIVIEAGRTRRALTAIEEGVATYLTLSDTLLTLRCDGEERVVRVRTDGCFMHVTAPTYINYFRLGNELHLICRANRTGDREGTLLVTVDTMQRRIHYRQEIMPHLRKKATPPTTPQAESLPPQLPRAGSPRARPARQARCHECGGKGVLDPYGDGMEIVCPQCDGKGHY